MKAKLILVLASVSNLLMIGLQLFLHLSFMRLSQRKEVARRLHGILDAVLSFGINLSIFLLFLIAIKTSVAIFIINSF